MLWHHANKNVGHTVRPIRRRPRVLYAKDYKPLAPTHKHEIHHIHFQRNGGTDESRNLKKLTVAQHRELHNKEDLPLRSKNGKKVMARKGHAKALGVRRQQIHRELVGEAHYSKYMSTLAKRRWKAYHVSQKQKGRIGTSRSR